MGPLKEQLFPVAANRASLPTAVVVLVVLLLLFGGGLIAS